jgi:hypothetical protein
MLRIAMMARVLLNSWCSPRPNTLMADEALRTTNEALRAAIQQHTCVIAGVRYGFRLEVINLHWAADYCRFDSWSDRS